MNMRQSGIAHRRTAALEEGNEAYLDRRKEIVQAAANVFKVKGLHATNLQDIAAEIGTDRATMYYYFGSKEELFNEVVSDAAHANLRTAREIKKGPGRPPEKLRSLIMSLVTSYEENFPMLYVLIQENLSHLPAKYADWAGEMRRVNKEYERIVVQLVQDGYDDGSLRPVAPAWVIAFGLMGMMGWTSRWFNPETSKANSVEIAKAFADMALDGMVTPNAPTPKNRKPGAPAKSK